MAITFALQRHVVLHKDCVKVLDTLLSPAALGRLDQERDVAVLYATAPAKFVHTGYSPIRAVLAAKYSLFFSLGSGLTLGFIANTFGLGLRCFACVRVYFNRGLARQGSSARLLPRWVSRPSHGSPGSSVRSVGS
eukprot:6067874-Amphidinium_carterae.1